MKVISNDEQDASLRRIREICDQPMPFVKCDNCGADIKLFEPECVVDCSYVAKDPFELKLQSKQESQLVPVLKLWAANPGRFRGHTVTVVCSGPCRAGTQKFKLEKVLWA